MQVFTTDDTGAASQRIGVQGLTAYDLAVTTTSDQTTHLLAGTDSDVYRTELPTGPITPDVAEWGLSGSEAHFGTRVGQIGVSAGHPEVVWRVRKDALSSFWVYRSDDGGVTWERRGKTNEVPFGIAVGADDPDEVVIPFWSLEGYGLYITRNSGETWRKAFHPEAFTTVERDPAHPDRLWLGGADGLYRSDDFGESVTKVADGPVAAIDIHEDRIVVGGRTVQFSTDGGRTFRTAEIGDVQTRVSDLVSAPGSPRTVYAATTGFSANGLVKGGRGVLVSHDGGRHWVNLSGGLQNLAVATLETSPDGRWLYAGTVQGGVHRLRIG